MKKRVALFIISCTISMCLFAQIDAGLFRYPDVSQTQIVFTYANDLWLIPKDGGTAIKLSSPAGVESIRNFPRMEKALLLRATTMATKMCMFCPHQAGY